MDIGGAGDGPFYFSAAQGSDPWGAAGYGAPVDVNLEGESRYPAWIRACVLIASGALCWAGVFALAGAVFPA